MLGKFRHDDDWFFIPIELIDDFDKEISFLNNDLDFDELDQKEIDLYLDRFNNKYNKYIINDSICDMLCDIDFKPN